MGTELHANAASGVGEHGEKHYDVFVVGGGAAGLGAAIACAQRGMRVGVCDLAYPPIDKALGEGLLPDAIDAASALGIDLLDAGKHFQGIRFLYRDQSVEARFSNGTGLGVRRTMLHSRMVERAEALGIELLWEQSYDPASVKARWVIGADGGESAVRRCS